MERKVRGNSQLLIDDDTVTKIYERDVEVEYEKSNMLWNISKNNGFEFPRPIEINVENNSIKFDKVVNGKSIRTEYLAYMIDATPSPRIVRLFFSVGEILGSIHRDLSMKKFVEWKPTAVFKSGAERAGISDFDDRYDRLPKAMLHGDYGLENIELIDSKGRFAIAVFDASPNFFSTFRADEYGPIYVDIGNFVAVLEGMVPPKFFWRMKWSRRKTLIQSFVDGYEASSGTPCDQKMVDVFSRASANAYFTRKFGNGLKQKIAFWVLFNPLKG